jgi:hypothetical protein
MRFNRRSPCLVIAALVLLVLPAAALAAEVDVFAEGAFSYNRTSPATPGKLVVYLYANINTDPLCSYGVNLSYDSAKLGSPAAVKNTDVWYMGASPPGNAYMAPDISQAGHVVFIGGKLDTSNPPTSPTAGVTGQRVLLGKVTFTRLDDANKTTNPIADPTVYFGIGLARGKLALYDNFVTVGGVVKDGATAYTFKVVEAGDATGNGQINAGDAQRIMQIYNGTYPFTVFADCNLNESVNAGDAQCAMQKYNGTYY